MVLYYAPINDKPHPPHLGRGGGYVGLRSYNLCPVVGERPIDCLGVKVQLVACIHCKKILPGVGVGEWWGKGHCCNALWGGKRSLVNGQFPHPAPGGEGGAYH